MLHVWPKGSCVVLVSDVAQKFFNMHEAWPYPVVFNTCDILEGCHILNRLVTSADHIVPDHDLLVLDRYPAPTNYLKGSVAQLDVAPD